jgi:hypothetical protein
LPEGGVGHVRPEWPDADRERLLDEFVSSPFGDVPGLTEEELRQLADPLVWFGCDYGPGDPLRWSPVSVEIVLADWYPRKVIGADDEARLPDVLAAFVRFAHDRTSIPGDLTVETLDAVERWRPDFLAALARPDRGPVGNAQTLARVALGLPADEWDDDESDEDDEAHLDAIVEDLETELAHLVGGRDALDRLDDAPLPDVAFDWSVIPGPLREPTGATLDDLDRWAVDLFDAEVRTIARAVLAAVVVADPAVFKRSSRTDALAAAILADLLRRVTRRLSKPECAALRWSVSTQKGIADATGVSASSISNRSRTVSNVLDRSDIDWSQLLHSAQRREVIETRRLIAEWRGGNDG